MVGAEVRVGSRASGVVKRLHVRVGDVVAKGQLLAELDSAEQVARRDQCAAALQTARANLDFARSELARTRRLVERESAPGSELDRAIRSATVSEAQVAEATANLALARTQLEYSRLLAPIRGTVASVATQEGETVAASFAAPTFVTLLDLERLELWAYVDETDIGRVRPGQQARFSVDAWPEHEFDAHVASIYPRAELRDNVVNYIVVLNFDLPRDQTLRPEMTAAVRIAPEARPQVLALPKRALRREAGRPFVLRQEGEVAVQRWIVTGSRDESHWEVLDGLREGDRVVAGEASAGSERAE